MPDKLLFSLIFFLATTITLTAANLSATPIYKTVDEEGNVRFTDIPPPSNQKSEKVELRPINTHRATLPPPKPEPANIKQTRESGAEEEPVEAVPYTVSRLVQPLEGSTIPTGQLDAPVQLSLVPPLQAGHSIVFYHNGDVESPPGISTGTVLHNLTRGQHTIHAEIWDADSRVVAKTQTVTFYVQRYHPKMGEK